MEEYPIRTAGQLQLIASAYRKQLNLTQADAARQFGVTQQTLSALEKNIDKASFERVVALLNLYDVEVVLRKRTPPPPTAW